MACKRGGRGTEEGIGGGEEGGREEGRQRERETDINLFRTSPGL